MYGHALFIGKMRNSHNIFIKKKPKIRKQYELLNMNVRII